MFAIVAGCLSGQLNLCLEAHRYLLERDGEGLGVRVEKVDKAKEVGESQFSILENEKSSLIWSPKEAKAAQDDAIAWAASLESKQTRLINVAKDEAEARLTLAL